MHGGLGNLPTFNGFLKNQGYDANDIAVSNSAAKDKGKENWMKHTKWLLSNVDLYGNDLMVTQGIDQLVEAFTIVASKNEIAHDTSLGARLFNYDITGDGKSEMQKFFPTVLDTTKQD